jgi:DNA polymerase
VNPEDILTKVAEEVSSCTKCELHHSRKKAVPGEGPADSDIMFIGEGPGFHENEQGRPFVGAAGKFLEELLSDIGLSREEVFISNVVKCRPPGNRDPLPVEVKTCTSNFLDRQIAAINPKVIVTLGRFSMNLLMPNSKISQVHGQAMKIHGRLVVPMYHPAAALHQGSLRPVIKQDFAQLPQLIAEETPDPDQRNNGQQEDGEPKQLSLF